MKSYINNNNVDLDITKMTKVGNDLIMDLSSPTKLLSGDVIFFQRSLRDPKTKVDTNHIQAIRIKEVNESKDKITVPFPYRKELHIKDIKFPDPDSSSETKRTRFKITYDEPIDIIQEDFFAYDDEEYHADSLYLSKVLTMESYDKFGDHYIIDSFYIYGEENFNKNDINFNNFLTTNEIYCDGFNTDVIVGSRVRFYGSEFIYTVNGTEYFKFDNETKIFFSESFMTIPIKINAEERNDLLKEQLLRNDLMESIKDECVPDYIDMEKKPFHPYFLKNGKYNPIKKIVINPHFRDRSLPGWNTQDNMYWAQGNERGEFSETEVNTADSMLSMTFELDDVLNKKKKITQSFFRLSIYDRNDPLGQMLLCYSTVFLNANLFFGEMIKNYETLFDPDANEKELKERYDKLIRCKTEIMDRNHTDNSSEGFYLYLFPDSDKSIERDIYMKVEFNHAGVGKTIPFIIPRRDNHGRPPLNFYDRWYNVDMQKYFGYLYFHMKMRYDPDRKIYMYVVPEEYVVDGDTLVLNVFEPKVN